MLTTVVMRDFGCAIGLILGALAIAACSDNSPTDAQNEAGGTAGVGGQGEPTPTGHCEEHADCESFGDCTTDLAELESQCDSADFTQFATKCGGTYVESEDGGVTASSWLFDAQGKLIGGTYEDEGTCSNWGPTNCPTVGKGTSLCEPAAGECIAHDTCSIWGANFDCPATFDDVEALCNLGEIIIERYASDCGGTYVNATNYVQQSEWTFDATGKLIGAASLGDVGDCDYWGTRCQPIGKPQSLCTAGGAGAGGAGGADQP